MDGSRIRKEKILIQKFPDACGWESVSKGLYDIVLTDISTSTSSTTSSF